MAFFVVAVDLPLLKLSSLALGWAKIWAVAVQTWRESVAAAASAVSGARRYLGQQMDC